MARLQSCCCGCSLELGCRIVAIFGLIGSVLQALSTVVTLSTLTKEEKDQNGIMYGLIMIVVFGIFNIVIHGLLLYGVNTHRKGFLLPWIIVAILDAVGSVVGAIVVIAVSNGVPIAVLVFFVLLAVAALISYFVAVVISFYQELSEGGGGYVPESLRTSDTC